MVSFTLPASPLVGSFAPPPAGAGGAHATYKMVVLCVLLDRDAVWDGMGIDDLAGTPRENGACTYFHAGPNHSDRGEENGGWHEWHEDSRKTFRGDRIACQHIDARIASWRVSETGQRKQEDPRARMELFKSDTPAQEVFYGLKYRAVGHAVQA
ncbi:MAG: hypothetical protein WED27_11405 [Pirellulales bacterium]